MLNLIHMFYEGGVSLFAELTMAVAVATFGLAVAHVFRPTAQKLTLMRPMSLAAIFATLTGLLGGWIFILSGIAATALTADGHIPVAVFYRGVGESLATGFVSFGFLAAAWMLVAVGMFRRGNLDMR